MDTLNSSDTAGQMNHIAPAAPGRAHMAYRGAAVAFFAPRVKADAAVPNKGTGMRRSDLVSDAMLGGCVQSFWLSTLSSPLAKRLTTYACGTR